MACCGASLWAQNAVDLPGATPGQGGTAPATNAPSIVRVADEKVRVLASGFHHNRIEYTRKI
ncbi:MAG TPA: hypothetical protein VF607_13240, partial [Verrucomicrobiae bacterium]